MSAASWGWGRQVPCVESAHWWVWKTIPSMCTKKPAVAPAPSTRRETWSTLGRRTSAKCVTWSLGSKAEHKVPISLASPSSTGSSSQPCCISELTSSKLEPGDPHTFGKVAVHRGVLIRDTPGPRGDNIIHVDTEPPKRPGPAPGEKTSLKT